MQDVQENKPHNLASNGSFGKRKEVVRWQN
jgi:hypothetical protein